MIIFITNEGWKKKNWDSLTLQGLKATYPRIQIYAHSKKKILYILDASSDAVKRAEYLALGSLTTMIAMETIKLKPPQPTAPITNAKMSSRSSV